MKWRCVWGTLAIIDVNLLALGINPPIRKFSASNAVRIQYQSGTPHTPDNIVDIGNNVSGANSKAFKKAINQLTHIGDDIYGKCVEEEGAGSNLDKVILNTDTNMKMFDYWRKRHVIPWKEVLSIMNVKTADEITDWKDAIQKIMKAKGITHE